MNHNITHHGYDVTAPLSYLQPAEPKRIAPKQAPRCTRTQQTFRVEIGCKHGTDELELSDGYHYRLWFELDVLCRMDGNAVAKLDNFRRHGLIDWRLWIGRDWVAGISASRAAGMFRDLYAVKRNRELLLTLCRAANGE